MQSKPPMGIQLPSRVTRWTNLEVHVWELKHTRVVKFSDDEIGYDFDKVTIGGRHDAMETRKRTHGGDPPHKSDRRRARF